MFMLDKLQVLSIIMLPPPVPSIDQCMEVSCCVN